MTMVVERIAGSLGAVVHGVDVFRADAALLRQLRAALLEHLVVFLPQQELNLEYLEQLTDRLGGRDVTPFVRPVPDHPHVIRVLKEPHDALNFANAWHTDLSYLAAPPSLTVLHAWEVPAFGGDTLWANQYLAFETLPPALQERLLTLNATHSAGMAYGTGGYLESVAGQNSMHIEPSIEAYNTCEHPMVLRHPETDRRALYVNPVYTTGIVDMDPGEAAALLNRLYRHSVSENFTCRIRWQPGMLAIWDNRCTQHFAINDYAGQRREMFRTSVRGRAPIPARD